MPRSAKDWLTTAYALTAQGVSVPEIAKHVGKNLNYVYKVLKKAGAVRNANVLTDAQRKCLLAVRELTQGRQYATTFREVAERLGTDVFSARGLLMILRRKGRVTWELAGPNASRSIREITWLPIIDPYRR